MMLVKLLRWGDSETANEVGSLRHVSANKAQFAKIPSLAENRRAVHATTTTAGTSVR
jgi:hypothetical protein